MSKLLENIVGPSNYHKVAVYLDWLMNDDKFDVKGWDKSKTTKFTKEFKKIAGFTEEHYHHGGQKDMSYPKSSLKHFAIYMQNDEAECKDLVRHIRNGFAHGNATIRTIEKTKYIEIYDYGKSNRTDKPSRQTAYLLLPVEYIFQLYTRYEIIRKSLP